MEQVMAKLDSLATALGKNSAGSEGEPAAGKPIPYERFYKVNERAKAAEAGLAAMREEITRLGTAHTAEMTKLKEATATGLADQRSRHAEDLTFARAGFDDGDITSVRAQWKAQPEEGRAESAGAYWESIVASARAHHEDPDKHEAPAIHRTLAPLIPTFGEGGGSGVGARAAATLRVHRGGRLAPARGAAALPPHVRRGAGQRGGGAGGGGADGGRAADRRRARAR